MEARSAVRAPVGLKGMYFVESAAFAAGDNGAGVAHAFALRGVAPGPRRRRGVW